MGIPFLKKKPPPPPPIQIPQHSLNVILVGDLGVGKTSIIRRLLFDAFYENYDDYQDIIGKELKKTYSLPEMNLEITFFDTEKKERYSSITPTIYEVVHVFIFAYDTTSQPSFEGMKVWQKTVSKTFSYNDSNPSRILYCVGTKCDKASERAVPLTTVTQWTSSQNLPYYECSSFSGTTVNEMFDSILRDLVKAIQENRLTTTTD
eukprot:TRINITY_DN1913_c0_g1_i5.p1 TRINITY_DN1913_c0_g1~~TRINITY_DN1913_c0_g1_i5.p1  ORF type:complete len:205 (+),score=37.41 TRINITY_DN1913_c0_g1_i5:132-746(+)